MAPTMSPATITRAACVKTLARLPLIHSRTLSLTASRFKVNALPQAARAYLAPNQRAFHESASQNAADKEYTPVPITIDQYRSLINGFFDKLLPLLEEVADNTKDVDIDVEYASGMLTIAWPTRGTYVINKQDPSRQIWLSSPISGPKRFDFIGGSTWVYHREGQVTILRDLLLEELGVDMDAEGSG